MCKINFIFLLPLYVTYIHTWNLCLLWPGLIWDFSSLWTLNPMVLVESIPNLSFNILPILMMDSPWEASANQTANLSVLILTFTTAPLT